MSPNRYANPDLTDKLPPFPQVALRMLELLSAEDAETQDIVDTLNIDGAFAAEVMRVANSPLLSLPREVRTIEHAATILGHDRLRAVTLAVAMRGYLMGKASKKAVRQAWSHSIATALVAEQLAPTCELSTGAGYACGLLHDLGRLALIAAYQEEYPRYVEAARRYPTNVLLLERERFGFDHCEAAVMLAEQWKLPAELALAATRHHSDARDREPLTVTLTRFSCQSANMLGFTGVRPVPKGEREANYSTLADAADSFWHVDLEELRVSVEERLKAVELTLGLS